MEHKKRIIILTVVGIPLFILGIIMLCFSQRAISILLNEKLALIPGNPGFILWRDMDIPISQNFYLYNITNPKEMEHGAKPILKEIGPFVYKLKLSKPGLKFNKNNTVATYLEKKQYYFEPNPNRPSLDTKIVTLNVPLITIYKMLNTSQIPIWIRPIIRSILKKLNFSFFVNGTADEFLFKGKYNDLQCMVHKIWPSMVPDCTFNYLKYLNNSLDGLYEQYTGYQEIDNITSIIKYNGSEKLDFWSGDACNDIVGTHNGELFPPPHKFGAIKSYKFFRPDFCRVFNLTLNETNVPAQIDDIRTDRFRPDLNTFSNASVYPPNACYRPNPNRKLIKADNYSNRNKTINAILKLFYLDMKSIEKELSKFKDEKSNGLDRWHQKPSGVFDMSACQQGAPIYLSYPHFLEADPIYLKHVDGLKPNVTKHESFLDIEPQTGTPVDFVARVQANIDLQTGGTSKPEMKSVMLPVLWQEFSIHITEEIAKQLKSQTSTPYTVVYTLGTLLIIIGSVMIIYVIAIVLMQLHQRRRAQMLNDILTNEDSTDPLVENSNPIID